MDAGLVNPGEYCYRNAALQLLFHTQTPILLPTSRLGRALSTLFKQMARGRTVNPREFNAFISSTTPFHGEDDAAAFLAYIGSHVGADICSINMTNVRVQTLAGVLFDVKPHQRLVTVYIYRRTITDTVDVSPVIIPPSMIIGGESYILLGVICHSGRMAAHGHYVACIRVATKWMRFDDATVTVVDSLKPTDCVTLVAYQPSVCRHHLHDSR